MARFGRLAHFDTRLSLVCAALVWTAACDASDRKDRVANLEDGGTAGDASAAVIDDDPPQSGPPPAQLATITGWETTLGAMYDETKGKPGSTLCAQGPVSFVSSPEGSVGTAIQDATADEILGELGVRSTTSDFGPRESLGLDHDSAVLAFADALAAGPADLNSFVGPSFITRGQIMFDGAFGQPVTSCGERYIEAIELGARFSYGLKLELDSEERKRMFIERFGKRSLFNLLDRPDVEEMEDFLTGHATLTVFAIQVGTTPSDLDPLIGRARCSVSELEGCSELLKDLRQASLEFFDRLGEPTVDDYAGWAPTSLYVSDAPK